MKCRRDDCLCKNSGAARQLDMCRWSGSRITGGHHRGTEHPRGSHNSHLRLPTCKGANRAWLGASWPARRGKIGAISADLSTPTALLLAWGRGDKDAFDRLIPLVHAELHRLARHYMAGERGGHTLQTSALVNEAYLRLIDITQIRWHNRAHFFAIAARTMRRILVDSARARGNQRRGGNVVKLSLDDAVAVAPDRHQDLVALDEALERLHAVYPRQAEVVELRFFGGLTLEETAAALDISTDTVKRDWRFAKLWLLRDLRGSPPA